MIDRWRSLGPPTSSTTSGDRPHHVPGRPSHERIHDVRRFDLRRTRRRRRLRHLEDDDGGTTWRPIGDVLATLLIGDIAIDPVNPSRVDAATRDRRKAGAGLYRSDNAGSSWTRISDDGHADPPRGGGPDVVIGGTPDNGTLAYRRPSTVWDVTVERSRPPAPSALVGRVAPRAVRRWLAGAL